MDDQSEEIVSVVLVGRPVTTMLKNKPEAEHDAHSRYSVQS